MDAYLAIPEVALEWIVEPGSPTDGFVPHHSCIEEIIHWNQEHLDAYLNCADIIIEQRDEPD
jgi:hypothetical protein